MQSTPYQTEMMNPTSLTNLWARPDQVMWADWTRRVKNQNMMIFMDVWIVGLTGAAQQEIYMNMEFRKGRRKFTLVQTGLRQHKMRKCGWKICFTRWLVLRWDGLIKGLPCQTNQRHTFSQWSFLPFPIFTGYLNKKVQTTQCFLDICHCSPHKLIHPSQSPNHLPFHQPFLLNVLGINYLQEEQGKWLTECIFSKNYRRREHDRRWPAMNYHRKWIKI